MTIQEPPWLKRTRPCPFFSQGRCLFADSCNFLHDVKVRSAVSQPLRTTIPAKPPSLPPRTVFNPPSLVIDSASPRSGSLASPQSPASPIQDSSRYSGLLSVLSDVIGPPCDSPAAAECAVPVFRAMSTIRSCTRGTAHGRTNFLSESNPFESTTAVEMEAWQDASSHAEPSSVLEADSEATLVNPPGHQIESFSLKADNTLFAEFHPVPDSEQSGNADTTSCLVQSTGGCVIGSEDEEDEENVDGCEDEDPTVVLSNRQSTLSSFTGASLLASPRHSVLGEHSVASPVEDGVVDLLSPVQLSAKLRPFPVPSLCYRVRRGESIDSGYADGDSWVSPLLFPRSPPRSFRSSVACLSHSRRTSLSSPPLGEKRVVSYDVTAVRPSPYSYIGVIKEVESDGGLEDNEDTAHTILDVYDASPSKGLGKSGGPLQVNVAEEKAEEDDKSSEVPAVVRSLLRYSPEHLYPAKEYDPDSCNQPSFISDDNLSFKTALSTQPSYEDFSDISRVSPVKQDSLPSCISRCSTRNTSVLSHNGDASELLGQPVVGQIGGAGVPEAGALEERPNLEVAMDPNTRFTSGSADELQGSAWQKIVAPRGSLSALGASVEPSHSPLSTTDDPSRASLGASGLQNFAPEKVRAPQDCSPGVFHFDKQPPKSSPPPDCSRSPSVNNGSSSALPDIRNHPKFVPAYVAPFHGWCSPKLSLSTGSDSPFPCKDVLGRTPGAGDVQKSASHDGLPANAATPRELLSRSFHFDKPLPESGPSAGSPLGTISFRGAPTYAPPDLGSAHELSSSFAESTQSPYMVKDAPKYPLLDAAGSDFRSPEPSPVVLKGPLARHTVAEVDQSLAESDLGSDEVSEVFESECKSYTQCLSFPLPPPFLPAEIAGCSALSGEEETSVLSEETVANPEEDVRGPYPLSQDDEIERIYSCSDLTEKARLSQLPPVGSPAPNTDSILRRSRAASDLTMKAKSPPMIIHGESSEMLNLLPLPLGQPRSDFVQSLYDQYFDDNTFDNGSRFLSPSHKDTMPPDVSGSTEDSPEKEHIRLPGPTPRVFERVPTSASDSVPSNSGADFPRSNAVLRPLLTGRRSFLRSSLAEITPKTDFASEQGSSSPSPPPARLQAREVGSTMVPLGFRRHRPQPATLQPLHTVLPVSQLQEVLRIRTDVARDDSTPGCSSAIQVSFATQSPLSEKAMSAPPTGGLRQLCLSSLVNKKPSIPSTRSSSVASSIVSLEQLFNSSPPQSPSVSSTTSFSHNSLLSSSRAQIPEHIHHTLKRFSSNSLIKQANNDAYSTSQSLTRRDSRSISALIQQQKSWRLSHYRAGSQNYTHADGTCRISGRTSTSSLPHAVDEEQETNEGGTTVLRPIRSGCADDWGHPTPVLAAPVHAIATPKPNLLFAIASDDVDQVRRVLESGEAGPNDSVGPQSALVFTLTNDKLAHKQEIVKALLAYGANPAALRNPTLNPVPCAEGSDEHKGPPPETTLEGMDPATRYFVARADAAHTRQTSQLIYRSHFRPLTRVRYDVIGQDWALEQLFRVLSMHSQKLAIAPIVVLLCGPSGHGKSLLARKFGSLLDVPTHTVNMTTVRSAHDIWQSYSMSPYEEPSSCTLAEFLIENEGKRCVVVLDEIEKAEDQKALWSLLMPWELGRCSLEAGKRHVDARNVIWLGTSNIGHELVFEHQESRAQPDTRMSREDYLELTATLRPCVSHCLGASLVSRVTTVLPFVPFTLDEKKAIAAEAIYALAGDASRTLSPQDVESLVTKTLSSYHASEGARSLHRAISNILVDTV